MTIQQIFDANFFIFLSFVCVLFFAFKFFGKNISKLITKIQEKIIEQLVIAKKENEIEKVKLQNTELILKNLPDEEKKIIENFRFDENYHNEKLKKIISENKSFFEKKLFMLKNKKIEIEYKKLIENLANKFEKDFLKADKSEINKFNEKMRNLLEKINN